MDISRVIKRNKIAWNKRGDFNPKLAKKLLMEEVRETRVAIDEKDKIETVDWLVDTIVVCIGELHKLGLTEKQIEQAYNAVCDSNDSKFVDWKSIKNEQGKIMKWENYKKPDFSFLW